MRLPPAETLKQIDTFGGEMNDFLDVILGALELVYGNRWVAPFILVPIMFLAAAVVRYRAMKGANLYLKAAGERIDVITEALGSDPEPVAERKSFAENYVQISMAMFATGPGAMPLVLAWRQFQEAMVGEDSDPVRNTSRPTAFFNRMAPRQLNLTFASNIFVGVGLILTFLGLIVALNTAARGMAGGDVNLARKSLQALLIVAGASTGLIVGLTGVGTVNLFSEFPA